MEISDTTLSPLHIRELNHIALRVRDLEVSLQFYREILGLPQIPRPDFGFAGAWFALGRQELHLIVDATHRNNTGFAVHFALLVENAHAAYAELLRRGVTALGPPAPRPDGAIQVFLHDPDGYLIEITSLPQ